MFEALFQSFDDHADRRASAPRVAALRAELQRRLLDGFIVPRADRYQNEYVPPYDERLAWLTGFTGSAGVAIVLADRAVLFVDGRYQVQVREEVDGAIFSIEHLVERPPPAWIEANLPADTRLGYSPWLHTVDNAERLTKACAAARSSLVPVEDNPIDAIWIDRPKPPLGAIVPHDLRYRRRRYRQQAHPHPRGNAQTRRRCAHGVGPAGRLLAVQHPRQRRSAHAGGARLRRDPEGGPPGAVRRPAQALKRHPPAARRDRRSAAERRLRARSRHARQRASRRAARSEHLSRGGRAADRRVRRRGRARP